MPTLASALLYYNILNTGAICGWVPLCCNYIDIMDKVCAQLDHQELHLASHRTLFQSYILGTLSLEFNLLQISPALSH